MTTNRTAQHAPFPLLDLPLEARVDDIYPHFSLKECGLFAQTSQDNEKHIAFLRLLPSAVDAEPESYKQEDETKLAAIALLKRHPELLFRKGRLVTDHYGRKIWASPYRLFLGANDVWALKQVHESIIRNNQDAETQAQADFKAQFPNCPWPFDPNMGEEVLYDARNKEQIKQVIAQLQTIEAKITADPCTNGIATLDETENAVVELCGIFAPKEGEIIRTGLHFPLAIQREIYKIYDARHSARLNGQPNAWSYEQLAFFSREVIGAAEDALTSVGGQCCKIGLDNLDMEKGPDRRDGLFCRHPKGIPSALAPLKGRLGRTMSVDPNDGIPCFLTSVPGVLEQNYLNARVGWLCFVWLGSPRSVLFVLDNLWRTKAEIYGRCYAAVEQREANNIVTMTNR